MKNSLKNISSHEQLPKLTSAEKESMRKELMLFMDAHPVKKTSSWQKWQFVPFSITSIKNLNFNSWAAPAYLVALFTIVIGGLSYTAQKDQVHLTPQEPLYITQVVTPEIKAKNDTLLLTEKLQRVESYLSDPASPLANIDEIETDIDEHTDALQEHIELTEQNGDTMKALEISSQLEITLDTHEKLIESLYARTDLLDEAVMLELLDNIEEESSETRQMRSTLLEKLASLDDEEAKVLAEGIQEELDRILEALDGRMIEGKSAKLSEAQIFINGAKEMSERANVLLEEEDHADALVDLLLGLHAAKKARQDIETNSDQEEKEDEIE